MQRREEAQKLAEERTEAALKARRDAEQACSNAQTAQQVCFHPFSQHCSPITHVLAFLVDMFDLPLSYGRGMCLWCAVMSDICICGWSRKPRGACMSQGSSYRIMRTTAARLRRKLHAWRRCCSTLHPDLQRFATISSTVV